MNGQITWNTASSCKVYPQNEFLNVLAKQMDGQMTLNTGSSCKVSLQNEILNVLANQRLGKLIEEVENDQILDKEKALQYLESLKNKNVEG